MSAVSAVSAAGAASAVGDAESRREKGREQERAGEREGKKRKSPGVLCEASELDQKKTEVFVRKKNSRLHNDARKQAKI